MATIDDVVAYMMPKYPYGMVTTKIHKLAYFAQGWFLAVTGKPLFDDRFEAWESGPVSPRLFEQHRRRFKVSKWTSGNPKKLSSAEKVVVDSVVQNYGGLTGEAMAELSRRSTPWIEAMEQSSETNGISGAPTIGVKSMREYFRRELGIVSLRNRETGEVKLGTIEQPRYRRTLAALG